MLISLLAILREWSEEWRTLNKSMDSLKKRNSVIKYKNYQCFLILTRHPHPKKAILPLKPQILATQCKLETTHNQPVKPPIKIYLLNWGVKSTRDNRDTFRRNHLKKEKNHKSLWLILKTGDPRVVLANPFK